jgi:electron transfer flavoprotein alpha subunit
MATLLVAEHDNKTLKDSTNKALTAAKAMGADVDVLVAGKDCKGAADAAAKLDGVKKVLVADAPAYEHQLAEPLAALIVSLAPKYDAIISPATSRRCSTSCRFQTSPRLSHPIRSSVRSMPATRSRQSNHLTQRK